MTQPVVIVTGGGRGIGRATCARFAAAGAQVVAAARTAEQLRQTQSQIEASGGRCATVVTDLACPDDIEAMVGQTVDRFRRVDVLVNNAGLAVNETVEQMDAESFTGMHAVNVAGVFHACKAVWPTMKAQGGGVIVNVSSASSFDPFPGYATYGASKAWVNAFTRGLAEEGRAHRIRVFAVAPAAVETQTLRSRFPDFPREKTLDPADVAEMIFTLAQPACTYATGLVVTVKK
jgi:NAD(P)-dependent dehydrogenase (short-subunit alcohol dehydrogenase family)